MIIIVYLVLCFFFFKGEEIARIVILLFFITNLGKTPLQHTNAVLKPKLSSTKVIYHASKLRSIRLRNEINYTCSDVLFRTPACFIKIVV